MQEKKTHKTSVGGQALIEGIMMQGPKGMVLIAWEISMTMLIV